MTGREGEEEEESRERERKRKRGDGRIIGVRGGLQIDTGCTTPPPKILVSRVDERSPMD